MALVAPSINEMFDDVPQNERASKFIAYTNELDKCLLEGLTAKMRGETSFQRREGIVKSASTSGALALSGRSQRS